MEHSSLLYTVITFIRKIPVLLAVAISLASSAQAQDKAKDTVAVAAADSNLAPFRKYPTLPAFNVLEMDSTTIFNTFNIPKGRKIVLVMFSPDCSHCKRLTDKLTAGMDSLANLDFYFITPYSKMEEIQKFYALHKLAAYKNVKLVGRDTEFFSARFYELHMFPAIAVYDEQKKLIDMVEGEAPVNYIYKLANP
jgi:thiol-disulfide isomerase/thioredoxin